MQVGASLATGARRVDTIAADLATQYGCAVLIERALERGIDLFICNAGTAVAGDFPEVEISRQRETLAVNVVATVELLHALLPDMIARARCAHCRAGVIVVSSMGAFSPSPGLACYGASKAFELHLARSLAVELRGEPIDLLALCPSIRRQTL